MSTPRFPYHPSISCVRLALSILLATASLAGAQTQASCSFTFFQISFKAGLQLTPFGINDFATVVGAVNDPNQQFQTGFIRWANGGVNSFADPNGPSLFYARNDKGVSLGLNSRNAIILSGASVTPISLTIGARTYPAV